MRTSLRLLLVGLVLVLILGGGAWWYLFGPNTVSSAQLVPSDTVAFLTIPNAAKLTTGYETSQLKKLVDSPNAKPLIDAVLKVIGEKNQVLISAFLPNLSGQSFIALTHFDPEQPAKTGFIAAMKPKMGISNFDAFVEKLKATYPNEVKEASTGMGNVAGIDYQWIKGPGSTDKVCVAKIKGWIVTTWGEASLQDFIERLQNKSSTPSLALNPDYQKSLKRVGENTMTLVYVDYHAILGLLQKQLTKINAPSGDYLAKKLGAVGAFAIGASFEKGEIVDRGSWLIPREAQNELSMSTVACPFDTLKFTGTDTRFYLGASINWAQYWKNLQDQTAAMQSNLPPASLITPLQTWTQSHGLDIQHNIVEALGPEFSVQAEWSEETPYPEAGLFVKLAKPDDFKPTIQAIIETVRATYAASAVINEINSNGHNFATLKFVNPIPLSPTITEDGDYFGVFLTENQAVRAFQRDESVGLAHNADFVRQVGDKRAGASQIIFLDSPQLLNRGYQTVQPYLSLASMFNKEVANFLKDKNLPPDMAWLAPMGPWSFVVTPDNEGVKVYSTSGVGNQGIFLACAAGAGIGVLQALGHPAPQNPAAVPNPMAPPPSAPGTPANVPPADQSQQPAPAPTAPAAPMAPDTNTVPTPAPDTNSNPDATAPTPTPATTQ